MPRLDINKTFMKIAYEVAQLSYAEKKKVGCIIVQNKNIIAIGYNGTPSGFDNNCEDENGKTLSYVLHAETNALAKCSISNQSSKDSIVYVTYSPCLYCAKALIQSGIKELHFSELKNDEGLILLRKAGIIIYEHIKNE